MTVEWVAIAAAVVIGAVVVTWSVLDNSGPVATSIGANLSDAVGTSRNTLVTFRAQIAGQRPDALSRQAGVK